MRAKKNLLAAGIATVLGATGVAEAGIISVGETIGGTGFLEVDGGTLSRTLAVGSGEQITDVNISVSYWRCSSDGAVDNYCSYSSTSVPQMYQIGFQLTSPTGTTVDLVTPGSLSDYYAGQSCSNFGCTSYYGQAVNATLNFDDEAASALINTVYSGTFQPSGNLFALDGEAAGGDWTLTLIDTVTDSRHLALTGWDLTLTTAPVPVAAVRDGTVSSLPPWGLMAGGLFGAAWLNRRRRRRESITDRPLV